MKKFEKCDVTCSWRTPPSPVTNCHTFSDPLQPPRVWRTLWTALQQSQCRPTSASSSKFVYLPKPETTQTNKHDLCRCRDHSLYGHQQSHLGLLSFADHICPNQRNHSHRRWRSRGACRHSVPGCRHSGFLGVIIGSIIMNIHEQWPACCWGLVSVVNLWYWRKCPII